MTRPIVFFADAHLADGAWQGRDIRGDAYFSFSQIIDHALKIQAAAVVSAGDLVDRQRNRSAPISFLLQHLARLDAAGIPFLYVQGQHDWDDPPWLAGVRSTVWLDRKIFDLADGTRLYGLDYRHRDELAALLAAIPSPATGDKAIDILVAHQTWAEIADSDEIAQGSAAGLPVGVVVSGDYHQPLSWPGPPVVYSPGSTCLQSIDEPQDKFFLIRKADGAWATKRLRTRAVLGPIPLLAQPDVDDFVKTVDAYVRAAIEDSLPRKMPEELRKPILRVECAAALHAEARPRVEAALGDQAHLFWKPLPEDREESQTEEEAPPIADLREAAVRLLDKEVNANEFPQAHALCNTLLSTSPEAAPATIRRWIDARLQSAS